MGAYVTTRQKKKRKGAYFKCETCGKEFYVFPSFIRMHEKNGTMIRFCSMGCYDKTGKNNPFYGKKHSEDSIKKMNQHPNRYKFKRGTENPNFVRFGEEFGFEGSRLKWWKRKLLRDIGKCETCGHDDKTILHIHHKDRNTNNNTRENLVLLCPNCHNKEHYRRKTGPYKWRK